MLVFLALIGFSWTLEAYTSTFVQVQQVIYPYCGNDGWVYSRRLGRVGNSTDCLKGSCLGLDEDKVYSKCYIDQSHYFSELYEDSNCREQIRQFNESIFYTCDPTSSIDHYSKLGDITESFQYPEKKYIRFRLSVSNDKKICMDTFQYEFIWSMDKYNCRALYTECETPVIPRGKTWNDNIELKVDGDKVKFSVASDFECDDVVKSLELTKGQCTGIPELGLSVELVDIVE